MKLEPGKYYAVTIKGKADEDGDIELDDGDYFHPLDIPEHQISVVEIDPPVKPLPTEPGTFVWYKKLSYPARRAVLVGRNWYDVDDGGLVSLEPRHVVEH